MASFSTIPKFWPPVPNSPTCLSAIPRGLQHSFSIPCCENSSPEDVTQSCYLRYLETKATQSQPILTCGTTEASLCPSEEPWGQEWHWVGVVHQLFEGWGLSRIQAAPPHHLAFKVLAANTPTRCSQVQSGLSALIFCQRYLQKQLSWI